MTTIREKGHRFCLVSRAGVIQFRRELHPRELFLFRYRSGERRRYVKAIEDMATTIDGELRVPALSLDSPDATVVALAIDFRESVVRHLENTAT